MHNLFVRTTGGLQSINLTTNTQGRGGGLVVSVPAFYSDDPSSNPAGYLINFLYEKTKINEKEAGVGPIKKRFIVRSMAF